MEDWKNIKIDGITSIEKIVADFEISIGVKFPYSKIKVRIKETQRNNFIGMTNIATKERELLSPDWRAGFGRSIEEALEDTIKSFLESIVQNEAIEEADFVWADLNDF